MNNDNLDPAHVQWCKNLFRSLNDGGVWGLPSYGLIFNKRGDTLVLVLRAPPAPESSTLEQVKWKFKQEEVYRLTKLYFEAAGVRVTKLKMC